MDTIILIWVVSLRISAISLFIGGCGGAALLHFQGIFSFFALSTIIESADGRKKSFSPRVKWFRCVWGSCNWSGHCLCSYQEMKKRLTNFHDMHLSGCWAHGFSVGYGVLSAKYFSWPQSTRSETGAGHNGHMLGDVDSDLESGAILAVTRSRDWRTCIVRLDLSSVHFLVIVALGR